LLKSDWNNTFPSGEVTLTSLNSAAVFHVPTPIMPPVIGGSATGDCTSVGK